MIFLLLIMATLLLAVDIKGISVSNSGMPTRSRNSYVGNAVAPEMEDHKTRFTISPF